ncbi:Glyoxalase/bleomycin resistance protein/dioxygenase [Nitrospirillum viridazoti Y2]|uniref:Enzyme related to lactoylglutathione lyase n=1 Tax=Nitrospirillum amazonense TaxID=28077 RepID=A0A560J4K2_9PROT|nr:VOC family protein [Nitrospirillum amazonense]EGY02459.1 Glyoxalase/bleomycin resistance protein/dioxygenase [Nitrospirillum amazonense Y2]TWB63520.1 putative enzyme related to lactoylglutathione lyase [Nitrospirillum amazonense]
MTGRAVLNGMAPFFIVRDVEASVAFYRDALGFTVTHLAPEEAPFFAIVARDGAMLFLKSVGVAPLPNPARAADARWDSYVNTDEPDALAAEFQARGVVFSVPLQDTDDGLRGFELRDPDGYTLFFGRPRA